MRKPRRTPTEAIEDAFVDLNLEDQAFSLRMLNSLHRQKQRSEAEKNRPAFLVKPANEQEKLVEERS